MAAAQLLLFHSPVERWSGFVRLVLEEKELEYDTNIVNSLVCENRQPWYLKDLNDKGELPTLIHKNKVRSCVTKAVCACVAFLVMRMHALARRL